MLSCESIKFAKLRLQENGWLVPVLRKAALLENEIGPAAGPTPSLGAEVKRGEMANVRALQALLALDEKS